MKLCKAGNPALGPSFLLWPRHRTQFNNESRTLLIPPCHLRYLYDPTGFHCYILGVATPDITCPMYLMQKRLVLLVCGVRTKGREPRFRVCDSAFNTS